MFKMFKISQCIEKCSIYLACISISAIEHFWIVLKQIEFIQKCSEIFICNQEKLTSILLLSAVGLVRVQKSIWVRFNVKLSHLLADFCLMHSFLRKLKTFILTMVWEVFYLQRFLFICHLSTFLASPSTTMPLMTWLAHCHDKSMEATCMIE